MPDDGPSPTDSDECNEHDDGNEGRRSPTATDVETPDGRESRPPDESDRNRDANGDEDRDGDAGAASESPDWRTDPTAEGASPDDAALEPSAASAGDESEDEAGKENERKDRKEDGRPADPEASSVPADIRRYERFTKMDGTTYERANAFLRDRSYITAREWAIARLCTDFRTETGVEMTKIGQNLPQLVPFMTDRYTPQAVNQARSSFETKVRKAGATFLYGAMSDFFTAEELDDVMYEATEVAKFLLEVEGADLAVEAELAAEDRISSVMREVHRSSTALRHDELECPHCGQEFEPGTEATEEHDNGPE